MPKRARLLCCQTILVLSLLSACATFFETGSVYRETGRVADLFLEPTLDVGAGPDQFPGARGYNYLQFANLDGHGAFDAFVSAGEYVFFLPAAAGSLLYGAIALPFRTDLPPLRFVLGRLPYYGGCVMVAIYDPIVHDIPVLLARAVSRDRAD